MWIIKEKKHSIETSPTMTQMLDAEDNIFKVPIINKFK